ncbi:MAG: penicillin-binding protein 2 [Chloroflexi bacterium]|nr:penicillin-binding protein 2 [Chloroflexota bacterium]
MLGRTDSHRRHLLILLVLAIVATALGARLAWWQVVRGASLAADARAQTTVTIQDPSRRGTIYDRSGTVVLATSVDRYRLIGTPGILSLDARQRTAQAIIALLGLNAADALDLTTKMISDRGYVVLTHGIDEATARKIRDGLASGALAGLSLESEPTRLYPLAGGSPGSTLGAQILGFVNRDGAGQYGLEEYYQAQLAGQPLIEVAQRDTNGDPVPSTISVQSPGVPGSDIRLSIDAGFQLQLEQELLAAGVADRAVSVSGVVMDPTTGQIYGEATYPSYNANDYATIAATDPARFVDPVVSSVYEPGSVFKLFTALAAFTNGTVNPATKIDDSGSLALDGGTAKVWDSDLRPMGWIPFQDVVAYSRNVGAARVALGLAKTTDQAAAILESTWLRMGFGQPTGIDLAGEVAGIVRDPTISPWRQIDLANGAFGQGVAVTPIQLATAYSAMVNGGTLITPHVVVSIGGNPVTVPSRGRVMTTEMSNELVALMSHVVHAVPWYRDNTLIPGYVVGGKTGTAQIWDPKADHGRGAWKTTYDYSFIGYVGRDRPQLVIAITIREAQPMVVAQGYLPLRVESYELFRRVATDAMGTLDLSANPTASVAHP